MPQYTFEDRNESVTEKLDMLAKAHQAGRYDLAMSLCESLKGTLDFEQQNHSSPAKPDIAATAFASVRDLPRAWTQWARGWKYCKIVSLSETVGAPRSAEPVDLAVAFRADQTANLHRDVRVARVDAGNGTVQEIPSQIYDVLRRGPELFSRLVFAADVPAHGQATYLVFYGNPNAELPDYTSDLVVRGEGYGLDIENQHYVVSLDRQMGQLARMTYKREHGLELYAGGKGHGEPPDIDWAHDYVDPEHFQKLRMRNWPTCPNYDVVTGPLCVRVRRWGFPHSPIHPLFTPSRVHFDVTYIFYASLPYFFKEGRIDMTKDHQVEAMRDDEWVFSGYSFTEKVWFDKQGKLHEGDVPSEHHSNLWGVGFYHRDSRDALIALWLEHSAENYDKLKHNGSPTLHYHGHGQLWSRYPAEAGTQFKAGASLWQRNAYLIAPYPKENGAKSVEDIRHRLVNELEVRSDDLPRTSNPTAAGTLARIGETEDAAPLKPAIWKTLREVKDEQLYKADSNIVDMGYVYDVRVRDGVVHVVLTMPHRGRPVYNFLVTQGGGRVEEGVYERLRKLPGVRDVVVEFTWEPAWNVARLTDAGRNAMGLPT